MKSKTSPAANAANVGMATYLIVLALRSLESLALLGVDRRERSVLFGTLKRGEWAGAGWSVS